ncbi:MAG: hypothetical protein WBD23_02060, partial [Candidatus Acidiferrales bacterium]
MTRREFVNRGALLLGSFPAASFLGRSPLAEILQDTQDEAHAQIQAGTISLGNALVSAQWQISQAGLQLTEVKDLRNGQTIAGPKPAFSLALADGSRIISSAMRMLDAPKIEDLAADPRAARLSERLPGRALTASFEDSQRRLRATWRAILRDGSNYLRQEVEFSSLKDNLPIAKVTMLDLD